MKKRITRALFTVLAGVELLVGSMAFGACFGEVDDGHAHTYNTSNVCTECNKKMEYTKGMEYEFEGDYYTLVGLGGATGDIVVPNYYNLKPVKVIRLSDSPQITSITIPETVTILDSWAFRGCTGLKSISLPKSVKEIGPFAFQGCSNLENIEFTYYLDKIYMGAFSDCTSLKSIELPSRLKEIPTKLFSNCTALTEITIPDWVTIIEWEAFSGCSNLFSITLPEDFGAIFPDAFKGCNNLKSIVLPKKVTRMEGRAFDGCENVTIYSMASGKNGGWSVNWNPLNRPVYFYSEQQKEGCWRYVNGEITLW